MADNAEGGPRVISAQARRGGGGGRGRPPPRHRVLPGPRGGRPGVPNRPIRYQVREVADAQATLLGAERAAAGLPDLTHALTEAWLGQPYHCLLYTSRGG